MTFAGIPIGMLIAVGAAPAVAIPTGRARRDEVLDRRVDLAVIGACLRKLGSTATQRARILAPASGRSPRLGRADERRARQR